MKGDAEWWHIQWRIRDYVGDEIQAQADSEFGLELSLSPIRKIMRERVTVRMRS
jgi:hypothetical protein